MILAPISSSSTLSPIGLSSTLPLRVLTPTYRHWAFHRNTTRGGGGLRPLPEGPEDSPHEHPGDQLFRPRHGGLPAPGRTPRRIHRRGAVQSREAHEGFPGR